MNFIDLSKKRYSVRKFIDKPVDEESLNKVLEAGRLSPTAVNRQPQRIVVLNEKESLTKIKKCTKYHFDAPVMMVVCYDSDESWKNPFSGTEGGVLDATIVITHMMLEAAELGLGTTFVGYFDPKILIEEFDIPKNLVPVALLPMGYPADDAEPSQSHGNRKEISETVRFNSF